MILSPLFSSNMTGRSDCKQDEERPVARFQSYLHGGTSSLLSTLPTLIVFPVYKTVFRQQIHNTAVHQAVRQLYKEGPVKLFRGVAPPLLMKTLNGTLLFGLQDTLLFQLSLSSQNVIPVSALPALAGFGAGLVEAIVFTPFERVQNVLQNGQNDRHLPTLKSVLVRLKTQGVALGCYRAFLPIAARNTLGSSFYFGLKGPVCAVVAAQGLSPVASSFISGTLTSMTISLTLYPLSVLVANMQARVGGEMKGVMACWRMLWKSRQKSVALLYRGGPLVILRSCITWGITSAIYDRLEKRSSWGQNLYRTLNGQIEKKESTLLKALPGLDSNLFVHYKFRYLALIKNNNLNSSDRWSHKSEIEHQFDDL